MNPPGVWKERQPKNEWVFLAPGYAVYGMISKEGNLWRWSARVLLSRSSDNGPIDGLAPTLTGAKRIIETLLIETGTITSTMKG